MTKFMLAVVLSLAATAVQAEDLYEKAVREIDQRHAQEEIDRQREYRASLENVSRDSDEEAYRAEQLRLQRQQNAIEYDTLRTFRGY